MQEELMERAELDSLVTQTFKNALKLKGKIYHNGKLIMERCYGRVNGSSEPLI